MTVLKQFEPIILVSCKEVVGRSIVIVFQKTENQEVLMDGLDC